MSMQILHYRDNYIYRSPSFLGSATIIDKFWYLQLARNTNMSTIWIIVSISRKTEGLLCCNATSILT